MSYSDQKGAVLAIDEIKEKIQKFKEDFKDSWMYDSDIHWSLLEDLEDVVNHIKKSITKI